ncbi:MAG: class I SAM-dependent methyltransferase [Gammaproteobacteria bacterium]|nr:class I SAM-dependent methyltransferase [Gammaproteobacteria bacterium]
MTSPLKKSFGFQTVTEQQRESNIREVFDKVAARYDLMNDAMSFGIHRLWKNRLARMAELRPEQLVVDLAGGTGDVASRMDHLGQGASVLIADPSVAMMQAGRTRHDLNCVACSAEQLAFTDDSLDTVTIAFGIRNTTDMEQALCEIVRTLKPGGRCLVLEFSRPAWWLKPFYDWYSFRIIPRLGAWIAREPAAYRYLVESIRKFPDQREFCTIMQNAGLQSVSFRNLSFGIACIHSGTKPLER